MTFDINRFKQSVDNFFTLPQFGADEKPKVYDMNKENLGLLSKEGSDKTYKITHFINTKNALGVAKITSFVLFFPLGIGLLINTARKWMNEQELKGRVTTVEYQKIKESDDSSTGETSKSDDSASSEETGPPSQYEPEIQKSIDGFMGKRIDESQDKLHNKPNDDDATTSSSEL